MCLWKQQLSQKYCARRQNITVLKFYRQNPNLSHIDPDRIIEKKTHNNWMFCISFPNQALNIDFYKIRLLHERNTTWTSIYSKTAEIFRNIFFWWSALIEFIVYLFSMSTNSYLNKKFTTLVQIWSLKCIFIDIA